MNAPDLTAEEWDFAAAARPGQPGPADWRKDTLTSFPAIRDDTPPPAGAQELAPAQDSPQPCPCGSGKTLPECDGQVPPGEPGKNTLLSCAEGVTSRIWRTRVTSGEWDDIPALADQGHARTHLPALNTNRRIRIGVAAGRHDIAAVLRADPPALGDGDLKADLDRLAAELAGQLADLEAMGYRAWVGAHPASLVRTEAAETAAREAAA